MSAKRWAVTIAALWVTSTVLPAATMPASIARESFTHSRSLERWSVGFDYLYIERLIDTDRHGVQELRGNAYSGYLGYDVLPSLTLFATIGTSEAKVKDWGTHGSLQPKWSVGLAAYMWKYAVDHPSFMAGLLTFKPVVEVSRFDSDIEGRGDLEWMDLSLALPVGYEIYEDGIGPDAPNRISLNIWAGPIFSMVEGEYDVPGRSSDFEQERSFGGLGGVDVYIGPTFCISAQAAVYEKVSIGGSFRLHF